MNEDKIRDYLEEPEVPEELSPENIKAMLDENKVQKKRSGISIFGRITAVAAALAIVVGGYVGTTRYLDRGVKDTGEVPTPSKPVDKPSVIEVEKPAKGPYMSGAKSYSAIYKLFEASSKDWMDTYTKGEYGSGGIADEETVGEAPAAGYDTNGDDQFFGPAEPGSYEETDQVDSSSDYSDTYNQESGVLEADIVKTDGRNIYTLVNKYKAGVYEDISETYELYSTPILRVTSVDNGSFTGTKDIKLPVGNMYSQTEGELADLRVQDMYLYDDMIAVICHARFRQVEIDSDGYDNWYYDSCTSVAFFTAGDDPQYIGSYSQDGGYTDVRIAPDGFMYLVTTYSTDYFECIRDESDISRYIPSYTVDMDGSHGGFISPEDILLPDTLDSAPNLSYTIIGSIDMTVSAEFTPMNTVALAGYTGRIYCSTDNLYTTVSWEDTDITRIAIGGGKIEPQACGKVEGGVLNQFSMSEYGGYFRIATTIEKWDYTDEEEWYVVEDELVDTDITFMPAFPGGSGVERRNYVYVLDMDMNIVGTSEAFGENEVIKSVNFSGDKGYVTTFIQTDPLFAFDLSDPTSPTILSELHMPGFSTYMQQWDGQYLIGFGEDTDDDGITIGVKLSLFDNSDPNDLKLADCFTIDRSDENEWISSEAGWDRKALLIAPERNLIGIPVRRYSWGTDDDRVTKYVFFSVEDGKLVQKGEIGDTYSTQEYYDYEDCEYRRALYIGDHVYVLSDKWFVSADIGALEETDRISF